MDDRLLDGSRKPLASKIGELIQDDNKIPRSIKSSLLKEINSTEEFLFHTYLEAIRTDNRLPESLKIRTVVGDLFSFAKGETVSNRNIIVIPVNSGFDTIVTAVDSDSKKQLVSANTIHGQWLQMMHDKGLSSDELKTRIREGLELLKRFNSRSFPSENSVPADYPIGTVVLFVYDSALFLLVVVSRFDERNRAQSSKQDIKLAIDQVLNFYDENGQGENMYLPLLGTNLSRSGLAHEESLSLLNSTIVRHPYYLREKVSLVIHPNDVCKLKTLLIKEIK